MASSAPFSIEKLLLVLKRVIDSRGVKVQASISHPPSANNRSFTPVRSTATSRSHSQSRSQSVIPQHPNQFDPPARNTQLRGRLSSTTPLRTSTTSHTSPAPSLKQSTARQQQNPSILNSNANKQPAQQQQTVIAFGRALPTTPPPRSTSRCRSENRSVTPIRNVNNNNSSNGTNSARRERGFESQSAHAPTSHSITSSFPGQKKARGVEETHKNLLEAERKLHIAELASKDAEIERLHALLSVKDAEIERLENGRFASTQSEDATPLPVQVKLEDCPTCLLRLAHLSDTDLTESPRDRYCSVVPNKQPELDELINVVDKLKTENKELLTQVEQLQKEAETKNECIVELNRDITDAREDIISLQTEKDCLKTELGALRSTHANCERSLSDNEVCRHELEGRATELMLQVDDLLDRLKLSEEEAFKEKEERERIEILLAHHQEEAVDLMREGDELESDGEHQDFDVVDNKEGRKKLPKHLMFESADGENENDLLEENINGEDCLTQLDSSNMQMRKSFFEDDEDVF